MKLSKQFSFRAWALLSGFVGVGALVYLEGFLWGVYGDPSVNALMLYWIWTSIGLVALVARLGFLAFYAWDQGGWRGCRANLAALAAAMGVVYAAYTVTFYRVVDIGNRIRTTKVMSVEELSKWGERLVNNHPAGAGDVAVRDSGLPAEMCSLLLQSGARIQVKRAGEKGDEGCVHVLYGGGEISWGMYVGSKSFWPNRVGRSGRYRWGDGVYGLVM